MAIFGRTRRFFKRRESSKTAGTAIKEAKKAALNNDFKEASVKAYFALETIGDVFVDQIREDHETARQFGNKLVELGPVTQEDIEPILLGFEIAKYSAMDVTAQGYATIENSIEDVLQIYRKGKKAGQKGSKGKKKSRKKPRKRGKTGASSGRKRAKK